MSRLLRISFLVLFVCFASSSSALECRGVYCVFACDSDGNNEERIIVWKRLFSDVTCQDPNWPVKTEHGSTTLHISYREPECYWYNHLKYTGDYFPPSLRDKIDNYAEHFRHTTNNWTRESHATLFYNCHGYALHYKNDNYPQKSIETDSYGIRRAIQQDYQTVTETNCTRGDIIYNPVNEYHTSIVWDKNNCGEITSIMEKDGYWGLYKVTKGLATGESVYVER